jgi:signal peptidase I
MADFHWDFAVLLTLSTVVTGLVWGADKLWLEPARRTPGQPDKPGWFVDFCRSFFPVIAVVLLLRSFVVEPFRIPSGSMIPTLLAGDFILVNKFAYGLRDPVLHVKFWPNGQPQRGDVAVFRWPVDPTKDFIKRIVGLPGDHIAYRGKVLYVNGNEAELQGDGVFDTPMGPIYRFSEGLPGAEHSIIINPARPSDDFEFVVPDGQYFAMGDNRDGSDDSRRWGTVPEKNMVGRAFLIWMSWDGDNTAINFSRIGTRIR